MNDRNVDYLHLLGRWIISNRKTTDRLGDIGSDYWK